MAKPRKFVITLTGTIPKGMTLAQARHAYWNQAFGGSGANYNTVEVAVEDYYEEYRERRPMRVKLGAARLVK